MNKIILMGRLTREPEVRYTSGEKSMAVAKFSLAVDRKGKNEGTDYFNCTSFGKQGEFVEKYLKKGTKVVLTGHLQNDNYTNKNGEKVYAVQIITEEVEFAESKSKDDPQPQPDDDFVNVPDGIEDSLPFK